MKRTIRITTDAVTITATINTGARGGPLTRDEVERARDELADALMHAASTVRYWPTPLNRVRVK